MSDFDRHHETGMAPPDFDQREDREVQAAPDDPRERPSETEDELFAVPEEPAKEKKNIRHP